MAIRKVCGIETEYGIILRGADSNPITVSSLLINAYVSRLARASSPNKVGWDFEDESPGRDARGFAREGAMAPEVETHLVNAVLTNGARFYVDHAHPEYSSPECSDAREALLWDKAGERILARSIEAASEILPAGQEIVVYKNNSDRKGNSYGCHENYLLDRSLPFARLAAEITPHFVSRQIYTGAGKVGSEASGIGWDRVPFQLTQRAEFFEEEVGLETTLKRPLVNTRDEPHSDSQRYRRLHVIVGDANLAEISTFLKVGVTALVLSMIEDDELAGLDLSLASPVSAHRAVSYDLTLAQPLELANGRRMTALEMQWELLDRGRKYAESRGLESVGEEVGRDLLDRWEAVLHALETDYLSLANQLDWVAKYQMVSGYRDRHGLQWGDPKLAALDLQYHDVRPGRSLYEKCGLQRLLSEDDVTSAITNPPTTTRAYFRGRCLQKWAGSIAAA
ncbi:MAG TPA: depupylase/deamidase Dop, partial [Acidimicrobiales bacterium]|nr:depupylase/deamidase Dop [Acidimicrobiales bacterium]